MKLKGLFVLVFAAILGSMFFAAPKVLAESCICKPAPGERAATGTEVNTRAECANFCKPQAIESFGTPKAAASATSRATSASKAVQLTSPFGTGVDVQTLIGRVIKAGLGITGSIALLMFVYGGFLWLTAGGSPEKIKQGKSIFVWAVLGLTVIFGSYIFVNYILNAITTGTVSP